MIDSILFSWSAVLRTMLLSRRCCVLGPKRCRPDCRFHVISMTEPKISDLEIWGFQAARVLKPRTSEFAQRVYDTRGAALYMLPRTLFLPLNVLVLFYDLSPCLPVSYRIINLIF